MADPEKLKIWVDSGLRPIREKSGFLRGRNLNDLNNLI
jgi:hypothetical protein